MFGTAELTAPPAIGEEEGDEGDAPPAQPRSAQVAPSCEGLD
jgi:hypothetical protein